MATVWAKSNGNWSATTLWAFWNETTQQIEDYGQIPQVDDVVYCNGHIIQTNGLNNQVTIRNDMNPYTNIQGGHIGPQTTWPQNVSFTIKAFYVGDENMIANNIANSYFFNGLRFTCDVYILGTAIFCVKNGSNQGFSWTLNGNVFASGSGSLFNDRTYNANTITINGNVTSSTPTNGFITRTDTINLQINGNVLWNGMLGADKILINGNYSVSNVSISTTRLSINGDIKVVNGIVVVTTLNFGGQNIQYANTDNCLGVLAQTINFTNDNANTFTWKDISEPRSNPFIIVTNADMNNCQQYPPEDEVKQGTEYVWGEKVGTYQQPPESVVLKGYRYDNDEKEGILENQNIVGCVTPEDVRKDVPLVGMGVVGSLVVPSVDDVREGVIFDNGSVGTLIVQGGGDRLRIADFGYYTNAQSDTYIVDLTEQDKPKFAVAEERVLIEMFPDLDLENIPEKYFDDLFVKYLKYRLIVEYYRTAGINSTFTPSEPTTEIVNYQNVRNEVWLNSANLFLQLWGEKYPNSVKKDRILL